MSRCKFSHQLKLLLWKNALIRMRHKKRLFIEFFWPLMLFLVLCWIRSRGLTIRRPDCHMVPRALPSVGGFQFIQNYICSFTNPCYDFDVEDEDHWKEATVNKYTPKFIQLMEIYVKIPGMLDQIREEMKHVEKHSRGYPTANAPQNKTTKRSPDSTLVSNASAVYNFLCGEFQQSIIADFTDLEFDPDKLEELNFIRDPSDFSIDNSTSRKCKIMIRKLYRHTATSMLWRTLKHFIRGWIIFTPKNTFTEEVMVKVDHKIKELQQAAAVMKSYETSFTLIRDWAIENPDDVQAVKKVFSNQTSVDKLLLSWGVSGQDEVARMKEMFKLFVETDIVKTLNTLIEITQDVQKLIECFKFDKRLGYETEEEAEDAAALLQPSNMVWAVVVFEMDEAGNATSTDPLKFKIRMDSNKVDKTYAIQDRRASRTRPRRQPFELKYMTYGFTYLQEMVERAVIEVKTGKLLVEDGTFLQQYPFPCYLHDLFINALTITFPLLMTLSWIYSAAMIIKSIVYEKEYHLKEMMKIMGLGNAVMWLGWFIDSFIVLSLSATILSIILKFGNILPYSNFTLIWAFMISYTVSVICLSFLMSTFFSRANSAAAAGGIAFFLLYLPFNFVKLWLDKDALSWYHVLPFCLISNIAFGLGCSNFVELEKDGLGALWESLGDTNDEFDLRYCIRMLWFDSLLYLALTLYIEAVSPASTGIPKPWYFLFQPSTYIKKSKPIGARPKDRQDSANVVHNRLLEPVPEEYICGVKVIGLGKTFPNGRVALKNLSIDFYENQITSFLGHNGAGKTTTVSILTGVYPPSTGTAFINGYEITKEMDGARKNLGVCPQYNVLFNRLTVAEHLKFFSSLKGKDRQVSPKEIEGILKDLGISEKRDDYPTSLSGGMKRKLCVGIAFSGGSKTVFLDEPTSGVDPYSRRSIWEVLLKYKQGRTIILTTHFMDEADILGDRIAIISLGTLKTAGSSLFLKNVHGQGYILHLVRKQREIDRRSVSLSLGSYGMEKTSLMNEQFRKKRFSVSTLALYKFIKSRIRSATLTSHVGTEISYLLPYASVSSFSKLFNDLDANLERLGILSYGISDTSLEDVFLKVAAEDVEHTDSEKRLIKKLRSLIPCWKSKHRNKVQAAADSNLSPNTSNLQSSKEGNLKSNKLPSSVSKNDKTGQSNKSNRVVPVKKIPSEASSTSVGKTGKNRKQDNKNNEVQVVPSASRIPVESDPKTEITSDITIDSKTLGIWSNNHIAINVGASKKKRQSCVLLAVQIKAIICKRFRSSRRSWKSLFFEIFLPAIFITMTLLVTRYIPVGQDPTPLEITPFKYRTPLDVFFSEFPTRDSPFTGIIEELTGPLGLGTECLPLNVLKRRICKPSKYSKLAVRRFDSKRRSFSSIDARLGDCGCILGYQQCPDNVERKVPPHLHTHMKTNIMDTSKFHLPAWTLKTYFKYYSTRHGGYQFYIQQPYSVNLTYAADLMYYITQQLINDTTLPTPTSNDTSRNITKIWYNKKSWISNIAYLNALHNMMLRNMSGKNRNRVGLVLYQHPLKLTARQRNKEDLKVLFLGIILAICMVFVLSFVPASFTLYLLEEKSCGGKHLQLVSGITPATYWIANFIYDMVKYLIPAGICILLHVAFDVQVFVSEKSIGPFVVLIVLYGWAVIPMMYPACYIFSVPSTAFVALSCVNLFIGVVTTVTQVILLQMKKRDPFLGLVANTLDDIFLVFPQYCLGRGLVTFLLINVAQITDIGIYGNVRKKDQYTNYFEWQFVGKYIICLFIHGLLFFVLNLVIDCSTWIYFKCYRPKPRYGDELNSVDQDEDVKAERDWVLENDMDQEAVLIAKKLTKFYKKNKTPTVNGISFAMDSGECFGLLGINGAGKTSTFKMLTGDSIISGGTAKIAGYDVVLDRGKARKHFGYCPQEDGLDLYLNSYEVLELFGDLRGLTSKETKQASSDLIKSLDLTKYANKTCGTYSGGNRRKLSTAVALIGDPDVIFLDEPTSGMDPGARRKLWEVINQVIQAGKSVVLTSHSMEECEALCTRLGIMVNGRFVCIGSTQHLKNRFGSGYILTVRCLELKQAAFFELMNNKMAYANLIESHCSQLKYKISQEEAKLSEVFQIMMNAKANGLLEQYSISQTTLDDIFVKFASRQNE